MADVQRGRIKIVKGQKQVRAYVGGELVADTIRPVLVWEKPQYPTYYLPSTDVRATLEDTGTIEHSPSRGDGRVLNVVTSRETRKDAALRYPDSPIDELRDLVRFDWAAMDEWFEEDEPVYTHPRDPYTRVDILASSRAVRVVVDGVTVAESHSPRILFETGLPPRYYLPVTDLRMDLLRPSRTETHCPYKGTANYWSLEVNGTLHEDAVWIYRAPFPESQKIAGLAAFYNERVELYVDGQLQQRPRTPLS